MIGIIDIALSLRWSDLKKNELLLRANHALDRLTFARSNGIVSGKVADSFTSEFNTMIRNGVVSRIVNGVSR